MTLERVNTLIDRVMAEHPHTTPKALAVYYEAVHQELAPLARALEVENDQLRAQLQGPADNVTYLKGPHKPEPLGPDDQGVLR